MSHYDHDPTARAEGLEPGVCDKRGQLDSIPLKFHCLTMPMNPLLVQMVWSQAYGLEPGVSDKHGQFERELRDRNTMLVRSRQNAGGDANSCVLDGLNGARAKG
eukprot:1145143-Pelagomonas_calceolata.AAC.6